MIIDVSAATAARIERNQKKEMMQVSKLVDGRTFVRINSSSLSILQECPRKAQLLIGRGLVAKTESPATVFGSAIHAAMETFYLGERSERRLPTNYMSKMELMSYGNTLPEELDHLIYRATRAFISAAEPLAHLSEDNKRSIQNGVWTLGHYFKAYITDPFVVLKDASGKPMVERRVEYEIYADDALVINCFGTIDVVLENVNNGNIIVCDHKTSSMVRSGFYNRLKPNDQYTLYLLGCREDLKLDTNMFMVNCLEVKAKPKTARGSAPSFPRQTTPRSEEDYTDFRRTVVSKVKEYLFYLHDNFFPRGTTNACAMYAGCQYLEVCSANSVIRENIIAANFNERN